MPDFDYVVIDPAGREKAGRVKADSADAARAQLDGKKLFVVKLEAGREGAKKDSGSLLSLRRNRLSHKELTLFTRQLSTLSQVSPLEESLRTFVNELSAARQQGSAALASLAESKREIEEYGLSADALLVESPADAQTDDASLTPHQAKVRDASSNGASLTDV